MKTKTLIIIGLLTFLLGCNNETTKTDDGLAGDARNIVLGSDNITPWTKNIKEIVITCDDIQEKVNIILKEGYKIKYIEKPIRETSGLIVIHYGSAWIDNCNGELNNINIYENESNKNVYDYLCAKIRWIEGKKNWLKRQEPNPCLQDIDFKNVKP